MVKILFKTDQLERRPEFQTSTVLFQDGTKKFVKKFSPNGHLSSFLSDMAAAAAKLKPLESSPQPIKVVVAKLEGDCLIFPFVEGRNVERLLIEKILKGDQKAALDIINRYLASLAKLPTSKANPTKNPDYVNVFGSAFDGEFECIKPGAADFNLDNLIEDEQGGWHLIDYEWLFDFELPKDYLASRSLFNIFCLRYQDLLRYHAARIPQVEIGGDYSLPLFICETYPELTKLMPLTLENERAFQAYVLGRPEKLEAFELLPASARPAVEPPQGFVAEFYARADTIDKLNHELNSIYTSKTYRVAQRMAKTKRRLKS